MEDQIKPDIGEEIIRKLKELSWKINELLRIKNEKEFSNPPILGNRS
jgi:hypothetical protein